MREKNIIKLISIALLFVSCKDVDSKNLSERIKIRAFNFTTNRYDLFDAKVMKIEKGGDCFYNYQFDNHLDMLVFSNDDVYFNDQILKKIDDKEIYINRKIFSISKYYYENKKNYKSDKYLYLNAKLGLIFMESLSTGNMFEYDVQKYHIVQKQIALNTLKFKDGIFELKYAVKEYKDFE